MRVCLSPVLPLADGHVQFSDVPEHESHQRHAETCTSRHAYNDLASASLESRNEHQYSGLVHDASPQQALAAAALDAERLSLGERKVWSQRCHARTCKRRQRGSSLA
jgi:hypothetical protein